MPFCHGAGRGVHRLIVFGAATRSLNRLAFPA